MLVESFECVQVVYNTHAAHASLNRKRVINLISKYNVNSILCYIFILTYNVSKNAYTMHVVYCTPSIKGTTKTVRLGEIKLIL